MKTILAVFESNWRDKGKPGADQYLQTRDASKKIKNKNKWKMSLNLGSPNAEDGDEPALEPINGQVFPPYMPRADKPGRVTNQLKYLRDVVIKVRLWKI